MSLKIYTQKAAEYVWNVYALISVYALINDSTYSSLAFANNLP